MENLERNQSKCLNNAGFVKMWLAKESEVNTVTIQSSSQRNVTFNSNHGWREMDVKDIELSETQHYNSRELTICCVYQGAADQMDYVLNAISFGMYLVKLKDRNGNYWLAGDKEQPLHLDYEHIGESSMSGVHQYRITLHRTLSIPLYATV